MAISFKGKSIDVTKKVASPQPSKKADTSVPSKPKSSSDEFRENVDENLKQFNKDVDKIVYDMKEEERLKKQNQIPVQTGVQQANVPSAPKKSFSERISEHMSSSKIYYMFFIALLNWAIDYRRGLQIDATFFAINILTYAILSFLAKDWKESFMFGLMEFIPPMILLALPSSFFDGLPTMKIFLGVALLLPWWAIYVLKIYYDSGIDSKVVNASLFIVILILLFFSYPYINVALQSAGYGFEQSSILDAKEQIKAMFSKFFSTASDNAQIYLCMVSQVKDVDTCRKQVLGTISEIDATTSVDNTLPTLFNMKIPPDSFIGSDTMLTKSPVRTGIETENHDENSVKINFACGIKDRQPGIPDPSELIVATDSPIVSYLVSCNIADAPLRGIPEFYFNATAVKAKSLGKKEFLIVSNSAKDALLSTQERYPRNVQEENGILLNSQLFGPFIKERKSYLNPQVGKEDPVQVVIRDGLGVRITSETKLLHGVNAGMKIPIVIYLKNVGQGVMTNVEPTIEPPEGFNFDIPNCNADRSVRLIRDGIAELASCNLVSNIPETDVQQPLSKIIVAKITYDYRISKSQIMAGVASD